MYMHTYIISVHVNIYAHIYSVCANNHLSATNRKSEKKRNEREIKFGLK